MGFELRHRRRVKIVFTRASYLRGEVSLVRDTRTNVDSESSCIGIRLGVIAKHLINNLSNVCWDLLATEFSMFHAVADIS